MRRAPLPMHFKVLPDVSAFVALLAIPGTVTTWRLVHHWKDCP